VAVLRRYLVPQVRRDLAKKMVFVEGPRQVGKTSLARSLPGARDGYLDWDVAEHRERILRRELPAAKLWALDELHKYRGWRDCLKGLFDNRRTGQQILVTGSARLDFYRFGGDSLQGRYHLLRLHPLSVAELLVECKWADVEVDRGLRYLKARFPKCDAWQISAVGKKDYVTREGIRVAPALRLLSTLV
jgi:predicted AAA+ superfamily ATPase